MYWNAELKCTNCGYTETDRPIDAETEEAAKIESYDCPNCGRAGTLRVVASTLRTRYVV
ncbi:MAG: hypothetical protein KC461_13595 [Dehalococcoidia bacterium]|nr:hypothetical protein [Dehalococcoidia bacterium]MCA9856601.1 hypothetical protein [Dehalococcoidia bacterium]